MPVWTTVIFPNFPKSARPKSTALFTKALEHREGEEEYAADVKDIVTGMRTEAEERSHGGARRLGARVCAQANGECGFLVR